MDPEIRDQLARRLALAIQVNNQGVDFAHLQERIASAIFHLPGPGDGKEGVCLSKSEPNGYWLAGGVLVELAVDVVDAVDRPRAPGIDVRAKTHRLDLPGWTVDARIKTEEELERHPHGFATTWEFRLDGSTAVTLRGERSVELDGGDAVEKFARRLARRVSAGFD